VPRGRSVFFQFESVDFGHFLLLIAVMPVSAWWMMLAAWLRWPHLRSASSVLHLMLTELLYVAGAGKYIVGAVSYSDCPAAAKKLRVPAHVHCWCPA